ncbi:MAG: manganese efflux pump [Clostridia bacterium]|nr:manganese efflux pump [Clostridia bacterium]
MSITEIILIGVALATDAFAVTVSNCTTYKSGLTKKHELSMPITFAFFQFLMPVVGFYLGSIVSVYLKSFSKYITATIFFILAIKIIIEIVVEKKDGDISKPNKSGFSFSLLLIQGIATSIDALIIGVAFAGTLSISVFIAGLIIGTVTFIIVSGALIIGKKLGEILGKYAVIIGAVILFILAVKNLIEGIIG